MLLAAIKFLLIVTITVSCDDSTEDTNTDYGTTHYFNKYNNINLFYTFLYSLSTIL